MVRSRRLELPRLAAQRPQRCASTNSATTARHGRAAPNRRSEAACSNARLGAQAINRATPAGYASADLEDLLHDFDRQAAVLDANLTVGDQGVVGVDFERIVLGRVELDDGA